MGIAKLARYIQPVRCMGIVANDAVAILVKHAQNECCLGVLAHRSHCIPPDGRLGCWRDADNANAQHVAQLESRVRIARAR